MRPKGHELGTFSKPLTLRTRETLVSEIRNQEQRAETRGGSGLVCTGLPNAKEVKGREDFISALRSSEPRKEEGAGAAATAPL